MSRRERGSGDQNKVDSQIARARALRNLANLVYFPPKSNEDKNPFQTILERIFTVRRRTGPDGSGYDSGYDGIRAFGPPEIQEPPKPYPYAQLYADLFSPTAEEPEEAEEPKEPEEEEKREQPEPPTPPKEQWTTTLADCEDTVEAGDDWDCNIKAAAAEDTLEAGSGYSYLPIGVEDTVIGGDWGAGAYTALGYGDGIVSSEGVLALGITCESTVLGGDDHDKFVFYVLTHESELTAGDLGVFSQVASGDSPAIVGDGYSYLLHEVVSLESLLEGGTDYAIADIHPISGESGALVGDGYRVIWNVFVDGESGIIADGVGEASPQAFIDTEAGGYVAGDGSALASGWIEEETGIIAGDDHSALQTPLYVTDKESAGLVGDDYSVQKVGDNLITNPGFEDGTYAPWVKDHDTVTITESFVHTGNYALRLNQVSAQVHWTYATPVDGRTYRFSFWGLGSSPASAFPLKLKIGSTADDDCYVALHTVTPWYYSEWSYHEYEFTVDTSNGSDVRITFTSVNFLQNGPRYVDDVKLAEVL